MNKRKSHHARKAASLAKHKKSRANRNHKKFARAVAEFWCGERDEWPHNGME